MVWLPYLNEYTPSSLNDIMQKLYAYESQESEVKGKPRIGAAGRK